MGKEQRMLSFPLVTHNFRLGLILIRSNKEDNDTAIILSKSTTTLWSLPANFEVKSGKPEVWKLSY